MKKTMKNSILLGSLFVGVAIFAQTPQKPKNKEEEKKKQSEYRTNEAQFRADFAKSEQAKDAYNLATSIHKQKQATEAKITYAAAAEKATTKAEKHKIYHNLGNVFMEEKKYPEAVEAYKNALRNNPNDEETRYNFALAKEMFEKNPPQNDGGKDDKNKDQKQDKKDDKDQQKQDQKDQKKDQKEKDDKDGKPEEKDKPKDDQKQDQKDQKPNQNGEPKPQGISKESLERLLDAVENEEQKVQDKVNAQKVKGKPIKTDKDW
jgi:tetratricopeptide (TPR) repeat protein